MKKTLANKDRHQSNKYGSFFSVAQVNSKIMEDGEEEEIFETELAQLFSAEDEVINFKKIIGTKFSTN